MADGIVSQPILMGAKMEAIDLKIADAVGGGLTLASFLAAFALFGPVERGVSAGGEFDTSGD